MSYTYYIERAMKPTTQRIEKMKTYEFTSNAKLAAFIHRTPGKFAVQVFGSDSWIEVFAEKTDLADRINETYGDPEFFVIKRDDEDNHVLIRVH